jgi:hypothetical protein
MGNPVGTLPILRRWNRLQNRRWNRLQSTNRSINHVCPLLLGLVTTVTVGRLLYAILMHVKNNLP